jgi:hypothetical protein
MELRRLSEEYESFLQNNESKMFEGRPERDTDIGQDDINNLIIAMNTTNSVEDFLNQI